MAKSENQKLKLLYLRDILADTDEEHPVTTSDIIEKLAEMGVGAERKSIYTDIEALMNYGMDITYKGGKSGGYYVAERTFELPELKLLVDAVQASKFITAKKSGELIKKLETLACKRDAGRLARQVFVSGRVKTMNESVYLSVDAIHSAISDNRRITFRYFDLDGRRKRVFRHGGKQYSVSPYALLWSDENYYLVGYDTESDSVRHYRVDKMSDIAETEETRLGGELFRGFDGGEYSRKMFSMFGGKEELVTLRFDGSSTGSIIDRFGTEPTFFEEPEGDFSVNVRVAVSPPFLTWIMNFGGKIRISKPQWVLDEYIKIARAALECADGGKGD